MTHDVVIKRGNISGITYQNYAINCHEVSNRVLGYLQMNCVAKTNVSKNHGATYMRNISVHSGNNCSFEISDCIFRHIFGR